MNRFFDEKRVLEFSKRFFGDTAVTLEDCDITEEEFKNFKEGRGLKYICYNSDRETFEEARQMMSNFCIKYGIAEEERGYSIEADPKNDKFAYRFELTDEEHSMFLKLSEVVVAHSV